MIPLCRDAGDATRFCPFSGECPELRQRIAAGYIWDRVLQRWGLGNAPLRGNGCSWYQRLPEQHPDLLQEITVDPEAV